MTFAFTDAPQIEESSDFWTDETIDQYLEEQEDQEDYYIGFDDFSDDADALASAGWGTDEDYGFHDCDF
jgi:hypothetical protein